VSRSVFCRRTVIQATPSSLVFPVVSPAFQLPRYRTTRPLRRTAGRWTETIVDCIDDYRAGGLQNDHNLAFLGWRAVWATLVSQRRGYLFDRRSEPRERETQASLDKSPFRFVQGGVAFRNGESHETRAPGSRCKTMLTSAIEM
jgi:hypothetical protein